MGEKFAANPVTGTGSMSVPIAISPGRSGFGPQFSLSYDSGAGNGPFGFGWNLSLPSITRKTDKGLPKYQDAEEADVFILSGAEDLVPAFKPNTNQIDEFDRDGYRVRRYRPRIEGLFARIERWTQKTNGDVHWRSTSRDNITTLYGKTSESRITNPSDPKRVFSWLICESYDDKGNAVVYEYKEENSDGVVLSQVHEKNRTPSSRSANRYLKRIKYGNRVSRLVQPDLSQADWMFEAVFDYGEHHPDDPKTNDAGKWLCRHDPFSSYRAGFEVRTYRLCQRVLMFHHFPEEEEVGQDCLVRSTDFTYKQSPIASFITQVTQSGYVRQPDGTYLKKSLPPLAFEYTQAIVSEEIQVVDPESLENLPAGADGLHYQWLDLDGEGLQGVLSEQEDAWYYKRNLSPISVVKENGKEKAVARFEPLVQVSAHPSIAEGMSARHQFLDLAGDGQLDVVQFETPVSGFYERTQDERWDSFVPFESVPNLAWNDPNLKFLDLTGDGHADILITENDALTWHPSLAEEGFGMAIRIPKPRDEEEGPAVVFADGTQAIFVADISGDGLTDLVRIRNGEVCYWPNLGYGRFGAKVTMDNAPWFDAPDQFDQRRIRLADIDGSGTTDIIYLERNRVAIYRNECGNGWSPAEYLTSFPAVDNLSSVTAVDLLGNGTACLVWTSPLPGDASQPMRYIDLMGGQKPHLLVKTVNNLGAETVVHYAPSTKFYLQDKLDGKPWITRLPFPVHVVEKVTVKDKWRKTEFSSTYSYHHGYFDGIEREFRGFGRVEQVDVENFDKFASGNAASPYITDDKTLYQPPVKTVTWFHTGAFLDRDRILSHFKDEYFPNWFEDLRPDEVNVIGDFKENNLPEPGLDAQDLSADEWREALRSCKGMMLRQEVYELDVDALHERGEHVPVKLFSTAYHNCHIQRLQPKENNQHAVFLATESEAITYNYELDLQPNKVIPDPRIAHTLNLKTDKFGNVLQSVAVVYPRLGRHVDPTLPVGTEELIAKVQRERHVAYSENRFTIDVNEADNYRLPLPCEVLTYELTGIGLEGPPGQIRYLRIDELRAFRLSDVHQTSGAAVADIRYHELPNRTTPQKRLIEHVRTLYFKANLQDPEPFGVLNHLGITYETYKLALTDDLLNAVFGSKLTQDIRANLTDNKVSGYLSGTALATRFGAAATAGQHWICSGVAGFEPDAALHFYLPERYIDPFDNVTTLKFDTYDLFIESSTDSLGNAVTVEAFDFRVLAPSEIKDPNDNYSAVAFDALGMPLASAVMGKDRTESGDNLTDVQPDLLLNEVQAFFTGPYDVSVARGWLGNATGRFVYDLGEARVNGEIKYGTRPAAACGILREKHVNQLQGGENRIQVGVEYSDGSGAVLMKKAQAEPNPGETKLRWVASGKTILNNKGKPVKQFEPYFSPDEHRFEEPAEIGVTPVMYYDAPGRLTHTELPDGSFSKVEFTPWHVSTFDPNDTVLDSQWYADRGSLDPTDPEPTDPEQRSAWLAAHHANTPATTFLDSLGREVVSVAHNKFRDFNGTVKEEKYVTFTRLDAEGKPLWIRDARKNLVMQYITPPVPNNQAADPEAGFVPCYDIAGNLLFQHSMDAGERWMLNDAAGKPMYGWDSRGHLLETLYDQLRRPVEVFVTGGDDIPVGQRVLAEKIMYGESKGSTKNHRGTIFQHFDGAGVVTSIEYDFKGNLKETSRKLVKEYKKQIDWNQPPTDDETFNSTTEFDALNRPIFITTPHNASIVANEIRPIYNEANLLNEVRVKVRDAAETVYVTNIDYNAKGQREFIEYGNGASTTYKYDPETFRLIHLGTTRQSDNAKLQDLFYTYDPVGNITHIKDDAQQTNYFNNSVVLPTNDYTYDAIYRLLEASGREHVGQTANNRPEHRSELKPHYDFNDSTRTGLDHPNNGQAMRNYTEKYEYDEVGNFLRMIHEAGPTGSWARRYDYEPDSNRLRSTSLPGESNNDVLPVRYTYDPHGNMTKMPHLTLMRWNCKDQLSAISRQARNDTPPPDTVPETTYYVYDTAGQRVRKVTERQNGTRKIERTYLGGFEVYREYDGNGTTVTLERETLHVTDDKERIALVETKTLDVASPLTPHASLIRYQFGNHLGSASLELDAAGEIISYEEYYPYGSTSYQGVRSQTETPKRYRYTGKERDEESGLYYHGARYYAPWLSRWTACDPASLVDETNLYQYAAANPIRLVDVSGFQSESPPAEGLWDGIEKSMKAQLARAAGMGLGLGEIVLGFGVKAMISSAAPWLDQYLTGRAMTDTYMKERAEGYSVGSSILQIVNEQANPVYGGLTSGYSALQAELRGEHLESGRQTSFLGLNVLSLAGLVWGGVSLARSVKIPGTAGTPLSSRVPTQVSGTWNEFQAATRGRFRTRGTAGEAWAQHKQLHGIGSDVRSPNTTRAGLRRTQMADWRRMRDKWDESGYPDYADILSPANRRNIARGRVPIVDEAWVRFFPDSARFMGEKITIHHIRGTGLHVPLSKSQHTAAHMPGGTSVNPGGAGEQF